MNIGNKVKLHNRFDIIKRDAKTGEVLGEYFAENIILDHFWTTFHFPDGMNYIHFGSGTTTPAASDVKLTTPLGYKATAEASTVRDFSKFKSDGVVTVKKTIRLEDTEYVGDTIAEVGLSDSTSTTSDLLTKALVKDQNGNPVTITKSSGDVLDIFATVFVKVGVSHQSGKIRWLTPKALNPYNIEHLLGELLFRVQSGSQYKYAYYTCQRPCETVDGILAAGDSNFYFTVNSDINATYTAGTKAYKISVPNITAANGNLGDGYRGLVLMNSIAVDLPNSGMTMPSLVKEVLGTGDGSTKDWNPKFGSIMNNSTFKLYVNDVEVSSGVTVDYGYVMPTTYYDRMMTIKESSWLGADGITPRWTPPIGTDMGYNSISGNYTIFENPYYETFPLESVETAQGALYCSNNLTDWTLISNPSSIGATYRGYRYWKFVPDGGSGYVCKCINWVATGWSTRKLIHKNTAPANGDTIACTYQPDCIGKDALHVLNNVSVTLTLGEYTP